MGRQGEIREKIRISLEKYIAASGYTQKEIAEKLGVSKSSITNWIKGKNSPDANLVMPICNLLSITLAQFYGEEEDFHDKKETTGKEKTTSYSDEAMKLAWDYDDLDGHGKRVVRLVADEEKDRCNEERKAQKDALRERRVQMELSEEIEPTVLFVVPKYDLPMSAGTGVQAGEEFPENYRLIKEPPRGTSYIAPISGNSMEPTFFNGQLVFVHATGQIPIGKVGVFFMDGQQWIKELGEGVLIPHNKIYDPIQITEDFRCQGLVLDVCDDSYFE